MLFGTALRNIEITLEKGWSLVRVVSTVAKLITKEEKSATLKLSSGGVTHTGNPYLQNDIQY